MHIAYLLTGTNLGDRCAYLAKAREAAGERCGTILIHSSIFETAAWGKEDQPEFLNQAICIQTDLNARELLNEILSIELSMGRVREEKYGARVIDIDILFFDDEIIHESGLTVPHPFLHERRFALVCMNDIAPELVHPELQLTIGELLISCTDPLEVKGFDF